VSIKWPEVVRPGVEEGKEERVEPNVKRSGRRRRIRRGRRRRRRRKRRAGADLLGTGERGGAERMIRRGWEVGKECSSEALGRERVDMDRIYYCGTVTNQIVTSRLGTLQDTCNGHANNFSKREDQTQFLQVNAFHVICTSRTCTETFSAHLYNCVFKKMDALKVYSENDNQTIAHVQTGWFINSGTAVNY